MAVVIVLPGDAVEKYFNQIKEAEQKCQEFMAHLLENDTLSTVHEKNDDSSRKQKKSNLMVTIAENKSYLSPSPVKEKQTRDTDKNKTDDSSFC